MEANCAGIATGSYQISGEKYTGKRSAETPAAEDCYQISDDPRETAAAARELGPDLGLGPGPGPVRQ